MLEDAKVLFIFKKLQHAGFQVKTEALNASITTGRSVLYTTADNHLITEVS